MTTPLSEHFTLAELTISQVAARNGIDNAPGPIERAYLGLLAALVLEPIRRSVGWPVVVSSGYRSAQVNALVGGARNSLHLRGRAADITAPSMMVPDLARRIAGLALPLDELILEYPDSASGGWVHVGLAAVGAPAARRLLTARSVAGRTVYATGLA